MLIIFAIECCILLLTLYYVCSGVSDYATAYGRCSIWNNMFLLKLSILLHCAFSKSCVSKEDVIYF